jgi:SOS-response transcriptional repressor LexA
MTPAQRKTLDAIVKLSAGGVHPTFRDVLEERKNRSLSSIHRNIHALARQGYIVLGTSGRIEGVVVPEPVEALSDQALLCLQESINHHVWSRRVLARSGVRLAE